MEYRLFEVIDTSALAGKGRADGGEGEQEGMRSNRAAERKEPEHMVVDMRTGKDLRRFNPENLTAKALLMLSSARLKGVYDYLFDVPGGEDYVEALILLLQANRFLSDKILAYETIAYCPTCRHYFEGRCTQDGTFVDEDECCDDWTVRRTGRSKENAERERKLWN